MSAAPLLPDELERRVLVQYAVSSALARSETVEEAASSVLGEIGRHLDWDTGSCWVLDPLTERLEAVVSWPGEPAGPDGAQRRRQGLDVHSHAQGRETRQ